MNQSEYIDIAYNIKKFHDIFCSYCITNITDKNKNFVQKGCAKSNKFETYCFCDSCFEEKQYMKEIIYLEIFNDYGGNFMILLIDLSWLYVRYYYANLDRGSLDPAISGITYLLQLIHRDIDKYKKIIFVLDGDSNLYEKNKLLKTYKEGRNDKTDIFKNFKDVLKFIYRFPKTIIVRNLYREADEVLAYLASSYSKKDNVVIYSGDKDLLQLTSFKNIYVAENYKNGKFVILKEDEILSKFKDNKKLNILNNLSEIIKYRVLRGDASDNIKAAIPRIQDKVIRHIIDLWEEDYLDQDVLAKIILRVDDMKLRHRIAENFDNILLNHKLMDLSQTWKDYKLKTETKKLKYVISNENFEDLIEKYNLHSYKRVCI